MKPYKRDNVKLRNSYPPKDCNQPIIKAETFQKTILNIVLNELDFIKLQPFKNKKICHKLADCTFM